MFPNKVNVNFVQDCSSAYEQNYMTTFTLMIKKGVNFLVEHLAQWGDF